MLSALVLLVLADPPSLRPDWQGRLVLAYANPSEGIDEAHEFLVSRAPLREGGFEVHRLPQAVVFGKDRVPASAGTEAISDRFLPGAPEPSDLTVLDRLWRDLMSRRMPSEVEGRVPNAEIPFRWKDRASETVVTGTYRFDRRRSLVSSARLTSPSFPLPGGDDRASLVLTLTTMK